MADVTGHSLSGLETEREELRKDLAAFLSAYNIIRKRLLESSEERPERAEVLERWSGSWASIGSLELSISVIERKIVDVDDLISRVRSGELRNLDRTLSIVRED